MEGMPRFELGDTAFRGPRCAIEPHPYGLVTGRAATLSVTATSRLSRASSLPVSGGAKRNRTADPLDAVEMLSQLSYSPLWSPQVDLNNRPHAYQACAHTRLSYVEVRFLLALIFLIPSHVSNAAPMVNNPRSALPKPDSALTTPVHRSIKAVARSAEFLLVATSTG